MKKLLVLLALCMVISVVLVACDTPENPVEDTTAGTTEAPTTGTEAPSETESDTEAPTTDTEAPTTDTEAPTTDTESDTEPPAPPADPVKVGVSFDQLYTGNGPATAGEENFFAPGSSPSWDGKAVIEDYNVQYVTVWGWVAFFAETPGTFGYQIGDADPVFDAAFSVEAEQLVVDAALSQGGKSAARMHISIPVEYLAGEEIVIKALAKDAVGTVETLVEFKLTKPVNPNAPAFVLDADAIAASTSMNEVASVTSNGKYVTLVGANDGQHGDAWISLLTAPIQGAQYVVIKYRTTVDRDGQIFIGSQGTATGSGDCPMIDYTSDDNWQLAIVDLAQESITSVNKETYEIAYLRYDFFTNGKDDATIEVGYIAAFSSIEAAQAYDAKLADIYRNVPYHEDVTVDLGVRTTGGAFSNAKTFGQKLPLGETFLKQITIKNMATYADGNTNTWALKIWAWNTDYATTVAGTPLYIATGENHNDNQDFVVDVPVKLLISGDVYYELEYLTGSAQFTGWTADAILVEGVETYVAGALAEGTYGSSVVVGVEAEPPVVKPENGSLELPLTVTETLNATSGLEDGQATDVLYHTTGVVTEIGKGGSYYSSVYFTDGENTMLIYTLNPMDGMPELKVGDTITVCGYVKNYKGTIEFASKKMEDGSSVYVYIVAHKAAEVETPVVETLVVDFQNIDDSDIKPFTDAQFAQKVIFGNYNTVVNLGTYDLSLYSKAIIKYATDVGYKNDGLAQIGFKSSDASWGFAGTFNDTDIIASAAMTDAVPDTFWALTGLRDAEIDLSGVTYNGDVWVGAYNVANQIYAIESITLIP